MKRIHTSGWGLIGLLIGAGIALGSGAATVLAEELKPTEVVEAIGSALLQGREIASARERAIEDGLSAAVGILVSRILPLESLTTHFPKLDERLLSRTEGLVRNYRVLSEHSGSGTYRVLIQATIATEAIGRELADGGLMAASDNRPVMPPARLTLQVEGTKNLGNFVQFRNALREVPGVRAMTTNELQANQASLSVDFNGDGRDLAAAILEKVFVAFRVEVVEMTENQLRVALVAVN